MSASSKAANSVVQAVEQVAALYSVPAFRMQSRVFMVPGIGGRERPMVVGAWRDKLGEVHTRGMADLLLQPQIEVVWNDSSPRVLIRVCVPLWVECKYGSGTLTKDQKVFRDYVVERGAHHLAVADDPVNEVLRWFADHGVER